MQTARGAAVAALAGTLAGAGLTLGLPAHAAPTITCQGKPATVVGSTGTEGDDVMVVVPQRDVTAQALGGDDTICIAAAPEGGIRSVIVDAGAGDDTVVNESADVDDVWYTTILGLGADSYVGLDAVIPDHPQASPFHETVHAGVRDLTTGGMDGSLDVDVDVIDTRGGDDVVWSGSGAPGAANNDTVLLGTGDDTLHWAGEQRSGTVDMGDGENALHVYPGWQGTSAMVSGPARAALVDGRTVMRWAGSVTRYELRLGTRDQVFAGTNADETLVLAPTAGQAGSATVSGRRVISMGGGDDQLAFYTMGSGRVDGGPGRDSYAGIRCSVATVRVGGDFDCLPVDPNTAIQHSFDFDGFEDLLLTGGDVTVLGSDADENIKVVAGTRIRVRGRGGDDVLNANAGGRLRGDAVVLAGGTGADRIVGAYAPDRLLGGRGNDTLFGAGRSDVILGGPGRDKAVGQGGRDRCSAEVRRSCELG